MSRVNNFGIDANKSSGVNHQYNINININNNPPKLHLASPFLLSPIRQPNPIINLNSVSLLNVCTREKSNVQTPLRASSNIRRYYYFFAGSELASPASFP